MAPRRDRPAADGGARERVWLSARDGDGLELLRQALGARLGLRRIHAELQLPSSCGQLRARLHEIGAICGEQHDEHGWTLQLDLAEADALKIAAQAYGSPLQPLLDGAAAASRAESVAAG
jgi:GTP-binding protein HflX